MTNHWILGTISLVCSPRIPLLARSGNQGPLWWRQPQHHQSIPPNLYHHPFQYEYPKHNKLCIFLRMFALLSNSNENRILGINFAKVQWVVQFQKLVVHGSVVCWGIQLKHLILHCWLSISAFKIVFRSWINGGIVSFIPPILTL